MNALHRCLSLSVLGPYSDREDRHPVLGPYDRKTGLATIEKYVDISQRTSAHTSEVISEALTEILVPFTTPETCVCSRTALWTSSTKLIPDDMEKVAEKMGNLLFMKL